MHLSPRFLSLIRKPLFFGICGAIGCLLAALILGEPFLYFTRLPPSLEIPSHKIALLIDCSGSMSGSSLDEVKTAATNFIKRQDFSRNKFTIIGFGNNVHTPTTLGASPTELEQGIANLADGGGTNMSTAIDTAVDALQPPGQIQSETTSRRDGILLFTDGQPDSQMAASFAATSAKQKGIRFVAVATGGADVDYLAQLTGDRNLIFYASSGQFDQAFQDAEKKLYGNQLIESGETGQYGLVGSLARTGSWTGMLAVGTSIALILGQNRYMHRRLLTPQEAGIGLSGGLLTGLAAGAIGQLLFMPVTSLFVIDWAGKILSGMMVGVCSSVIASVFMPKVKLQSALLQGAIVGSVGSVAYIFTALGIGDFWAKVLFGVVFLVLMRSPNGLMRLSSIALVAAAIAQFSFLSWIPASGFGVIGRMAGWIFLGLFLGGGMSAFIPNLQFQRALLGGGIGGLGGVAMFILISGVAGDMVGRLVGATALGFFIGLMIALLEQLVLQRKASLIVHWSATEKTQLALRATPIILGSSSEAHIPLSKSSYPPITAKVSLIDQEVVMEFDEAMRKQTSMKILRHTLKNGDERKFGTMKIEVQIAGHNTTH
jgi:Ca-activated chloride channel homolog